MDERREERSHDHRPGDVIELVEQLLGAVAFQRRKPLDGPHHDGPVGEEVIGGQHHHQQGDDRLAEKSRGPQGQGGQKLLRAFDDVGLHILHILGSEGDPDALGEADNLVGGPIGQLAHVGRRPRLGRGIDQWRILDGHLVDGLGFATGLDQQKQ